MAWMRFVLIAGSDSIRTSSSSICDCFFVLWLMAAVMVLLLSISLILLYRGVIMEIRCGESGNTHFRTARFFCISGDWYFSTRENLQVGPFSNRDEAEGELMLFLRHVNEGGIFATSHSATA